MRRQNSLSRRRDKQTGQIDIEPNPSISQLSHTLHVGSVHGQHIEAFSRTQTASGVAMLPPDLFTPILEMAISQNDSFDADTNFYPFYDIPELLKINEVCRHWRWMALSSPSLWTYIPTNMHPDLITLFVQRSADALLHVKLTHKVFREWDADRRSQKLSLSKLALLTPYFHRTRFLSLTLSTFTLSKIDTELIPSRCDLPFLEGLQFRTDSILTIQSQVAVEESQRELVLSLLGKLGMPVLRGLHFAGVTIPAASIPAMSLSRLSLTVNGGDSDLKHYLADVFKRCDSLVSLSLNVWQAGGVLVPTLLTTVTSPSESQALDLPSLRRLVMKGICRQCLAVSRMLQMSSLMEVCLNIGNSGFEHVIQVIPSTPLGNHLSIKADDTEMHVDFANTYDGAKEGSVFTLIIKGHLPRGVLSSAKLLGLFGARSFPEVAIVDYTTPYIYDRIFITPFLSHFPGLQTLRIRYTNTDRKFPIEESFDLKSLLPLATGRNRNVMSLRNLILDGFDVVMPQASLFLLELSSIPRRRRDLGLVPFVAEFPNCKGIPDSLLRATALERADSSVSMSSNVKE